MKRVAFAVAMAVVMAGSTWLVVKAEQDRDDDSAEHRAEVAAEDPVFHRPGAERDPFFHRKDTGETVHVLPPHANIRGQRDQVPVFAPASNKTAVYGASYGSGNLLDHGGLEIANAGFWAIYWNSAVAGATATSTTTNKPYATLQAELDDFVTNFPDNANYSGSPNDDYPIIQQYGTKAPIANYLTKYGAYVDKSATATSITDAKLQSYLAGLFNTKKVSAYSNVIYGIFLPPGMKVTLGTGTSCSSFCGYHSHFSYSGMQVKYAVFPYLNCAACSLSTLKVADMMTIVMSHEIREAVTNPGDSGKGAWFDASGYEADDKCAWHNLYQMTRGGFWVQPEFSNGGTVTRSGFTATYPSAAPGVGGCVVPK